MQFCFRIEKWVWMHSLCALSAFLVGCGPGDALNRNPPARTKTYSGAFSAVSHYPHEIVVRKWEGFGWACPPGGNFIPNAEAGCFFAPLDSFPSKTAVVWQVDGETEFKRNELDLKDVVPANVKGVTAFTLSEDGVWSVQFVPEVAK